LSINITNYGIFLAIWLPVTFAYIVYLARQKSDNAPLTVFWGTLAIIIPVIGIVYIYLLNKKPNISY